VEPTLIELDSSKAVASSKTGVEVLDGRTVSSEASNQKHVNCKLCAFVRAPSAAIDPRRHQDICPLATGAPEEEAGRSRRGESDDIAANPPKEQEQIVDAVTLN